MPVNLDFKNTFLLNENNLKSISNNNFKRISNHLTLAQKRSKKILKRRQYDNKRRQVPDPFRMFVKTQKGSMSNALLLETC